MRNAVKQILGLLPVCLVNPPLFPPFSFFLTIVTQLEETSQAAYPTILDSLKLC